MRLLVTTDQWSPDVAGGSARVAADTARALARRGHEVTVLAPARRGKPASEDDAGVEVRRCIRRGPLPQTYADVLQTWRRARGRRADVVLAHQATNAVGALLARVDAPLVLVFHASAPLEQRFHRRRLPPARRLVSRAMHPTFIRLERTAVERAERLLVLSEYSRDLLTGAHPAAAGRVAVVGGGVDTSVFHPRPEARERVDGRLGLTPRVPLLLTVRRLDPRMGLEELLQACARLAAGGRDFALAVAGDGMLAGHLRGLAEQLRLGDRVRFLGRVSEEELRELYAAADLFVLPTVAYEGFGMATVEALASGTPVVGTAVGATPELLVPLDPGLVSASAEPDVLAETISGALGRLDSSLRERCAAYGRELGWETAIVRWEAELERAAVSAGPSPADHDPSAPAPSNVSYGSLR